MLLKDTNYLFRHTSYGSSIEILYYSKQKKKLKISETFRATHMGSGFMSLNWDIEIGPVFLFLSFQANLSYL